VQHLDLHVFVPQHCRLTHSAQRRKKKRDSGVYQATSFKHKFKADPHSK
jgi:hypothetical protein